MTLHELWLLHTHKQLVRDLGGDWLYEAAEEGFLIHYRNRTGGLVITRSPRDDQMLLVSRLLAHQPASIGEFRLTSSYALSDLHRGVSDQLLRVIGY